MQQKCFVRLRWLVTKDFWSCLPRYVMGYGPVAVMVAIVITLLGNSTSVQAQTSAIDVSGMDIDGASIAATAINIVNAFVPVLVLVGGFGLGLYIVGRIIGMLR